MLDFYTLRALAHEWNGLLVGRRLAEAYSQSRAELTLVLADAAGEVRAVRVGVGGGRLYTFSAEGYNRARRNTADRFEGAAGRIVTRVGVAHRDRVLLFDLDDGSTLQLPLFGPRANVLHVGPDGRIGEAFRQQDALRGQPAPTPRAAPDVPSFERFEARWKPDRPSLAHAVAAAMPLFDRVLGAEAAHRAGLDGDPAACTAAERRALYDAAAALEAELETPRPRIYREGRHVLALALVPLRHLADYEEETFDTVDEAVRVYSRNVLAEQRWQAAYVPLRDALLGARDDDARRAERMLEELSQPSRADRYERWGHLLMAAHTQVPPGADRAVLPDLYGDGDVEIALDPGLSAIENAQRYYARARRTRAAREHAESRMAEVAGRADAAGALLEALQACETPREVEAFRKEHAEALEPFLPRRQQTDAVPFRRVALGQGYEAWIGRNARQNDQLTFRHASKHDLWLHARGVPGSHVVVRVPAKNATVPAPVVERAAALAAFHSKARGSALVPVMVAERKYVRRAKGGPPGAVLVEREQVLMVEPREAV